LFNIEEGTMDWNEARDVLNSIQKKHSGEAEKIIERLFAIALIRAGCDIRAEKPRHGVDMDVIHRETGRRMSFLVRSTRTLEIVLEDEELEGLRQGQGKGHRPLVAALIMPICFSEGWVISTPVRFKAGRHKSTGLLRARDEEISESINSAFLEVLGELGHAVLKGRPGEALQVLRER
jgi:hypothetical protein